MKLTEAKKILVTDLMHIGDIIFITPFLYVLRHAAPQAEITLLVDLKTQDVVKYNPNIDHVLTIDKKGKDDNFKALWNFAANLRKQHYDITINLHPNERCSFLAGFSGAKYKAGVSAGVFKLWFDEVFKFNWAREVQVIDMYLDILKKLGVAEIKHQGVEMYISDQEKQFSTVFYQDKGVYPGDTIVGINVGGSWPTKRWTTEGFAQVADHYIDKGFKVLFFGGPMDIELVDAITVKMRHVPLRATGKTTLLQLAALISRCNVFISGDSGPIHIAATQKVPIVAIYGPSDWIKFPPFIDNKVIITAELDCQPCGEHHCDHHSCMKNITSETVVEAVKRLTNI